MTSISNSVQTESAITPSGQASQQLNVNYDNFLQLLTAQISNQDPLAPMEGTEFVSQLAQLSQVEQSIQTNTNLEAISASLAIDLSRADIGLIGRDVMVQTDRFDLREDGALIAYALHDEADLAVVSIRDAQGAIVRQLTSLPEPQGDLQDVAWDGLDDQGLPTPLGVYSFEVTGYDGVGAKIGAVPHAVVHVDGVKIDGSASALRLSNGTEIDSSNVLEVR